MLKGLRIPYKPCSPDRLEKILGISFSLRAVLGIIASLALFAAVFLGGMAYIRGLTFFFFFSVLSPCSGYGLIVSGQTWGVRSDEVGKGDTREAR